MSTYAITDISQDYNIQRELIKLPRALMGGTQAMRKNGEAYLPKKAAEDSADYQARLKGAVLVNYMAQTVDYLSGQVFQKPVDYQPLEEGGAPVYDPDFFAAFKENVDLAGNNLSAFSLEFFKDGVIDGLSFILVDYSRVNIFRSEDGALMYAREDGSAAPKTRAADAENGWRPYLVKIRAGQVLDAWVMVEDGREQLKHFRYEESYERAIDGGRGLVRETVKRIRSFWPGKWEVWEMEEGSSQPVMIASGSTSLSYIPIFWFMPGKRRPEAVTADPPLADLAEMNRAHWDAYSNHLELMKWVRSPVWLGVNLAPPDGGKIQFGPSRFISAVSGMDGANPDLRSIGVTSDSVTKSHEDLEKMQTSMESYGLQVALNPAGYATTATQVATAANASDSQLKGWCVGLQDCLENALKAVAEYNGGADGPAIYINTTFRQTFDGSKANFLKSMRDGGDLSLPTFLSEIKQMGGINDEIVIADEIARLNEEQANSLPTLSGFNPASDGAET